MTDTVKVPASLVVQSALRSLSLAEEALALLQREVRDGELGGTLSQAVGLIRQRPGRLIVTGVGKSGHIARKLAATFSSTGTPAYHLHPTEANHGDLGMVDRDDVILALSWSGETSELAQTVTYAKRFGVPLISITAALESTLAKASNVALVLPKVREACPNNLAPTTSTLLQLAVGDALAVALIEDRGFSADDFKIFHPGGKLGSQLLTVADVMHRGETVPLVGIGRTMEAAIATMTAHGFGVVGVTDADGVLVGAVTDGDLRRHMSTDLLTRKVEEVMSRAPVTISPGAIAGEALKILETRRIGALFVVENDRPVGLIRTLDLLRAGIA
ncbi:KpsF/GutQ family sugar-phosphate isomerase [Aureimonas fodinaquatilis]|uniref:KpsF/GutQ family sugar-phosphate isomerase n=1 Tax=Aureimonas fodinaquatilis TaxID=2565783 RepID=A0A5B0DR29_9HYPH|nr:KpsF/GutQ family sugar-phosphate isomerase [Aureimonas fodinaquatilis]KAA0968956.1 KpsF/GutQ family sugar-phosphate isomerase [Aureimonas fodinaquatilis]